MPWNDRQRQVLRWVFEGRMSQEKMALSVTVPSRTVKRWIAHPDFQQRLADMRADFLAGLQDVTYADKARRIVALDQMAESARQEYEARPWLREVRPLPMKTAVRLRGKSAAGEEMVEETEPVEAIVNESFNEGAFAAFRGALDDIAKELGQRKPVNDAGAAPSANLQVVFMLPETESEPSGGAVVSAGASVAAIEAAAHAFPDFPEPDDGK